MESASRFGYSARCVQSAQKPGRPSGAWPKLRKPTRHAAASFANPPAPLSAGTSPSRIPSMQRQREEWKARRALCTRSPLFSGGAYPCATGSAGIGLASHFHPSLPWVPSQKGRLDDKPQRQREIAGFPVRSHSCPFTSTSEIGPSTRNGPLGRTVILTAAAGAACAETDTSSDIELLGCGGMQEPPHKPSIAKPHKRCRASTVYVLRPVHGDMSASG